MTPSTHPSHTGRRFPPEVINHAVWLYFRFPLSLRTVKEMLAARGTFTGHESVRQWAHKFAQGFASEIRRRPPGPGDKWHLDEVRSESPVRSTGCGARSTRTAPCSMLVQNRRDKRAAKRVLRKLLKKQGRPSRVLVTDQLASYPVAKQKLMPGVEHRRHKGLNNRADVSHQPTRRRERQMKQFKSASQVRRFLSARDQINNRFCLHRDHRPGVEERADRAQVFAIWAEVRGGEAAA